MTRQHGWEGRLSPTERLFKTHFTKRPAELAISNEVSFRMEFLKINLHELSTLARVSEKEVQYIRVGLFLLENTDPGDIARIATLLKTDADELFKIGRQAEAKGRESKPASRRSYAFLLEALIRDMNISPDNYKKAVEIGIAARLRRESVPRMTRRRFSSATGISEEYISLLEHGNVPERFLDERVDVIADKLGTERERLLADGSRLVELFRSRYRSLSLSKLADKLKSYAYERVKEWDVKSAMRI